MRIELVSHHVSAMVLSVSRELGFPFGPFMRETGMPNPEVAPITWDQLTFFVDAVVDHAGYDAFEEVVGNMPRLAPRSMALFSAFVGPVQLYDFINGGSGRRCTRCSRTGTSPTPTAPSSSRTSSAAASGRAGASSACSAPPRQRSPRSSGSPPRRGS